MCYHRLPLLKYQGLMLPCDPPQVLVHAVWQGVGSCSAGDLQLLVDHQTPSHISSPPYSSPPQLLILLTPLPTVYFLFSNDVLPPPSGSVLRLISAHFPALFYPHFHFSWPTFSPPFLQPPLLLISTSWPEALSGASTSHPLLPSAECFQLHGAVWSPLTWDSKCAAQLQAAYLGRPF